MNTTAVALFVLLAPLPLAAQDSKPGDKGSPLDLKVTARKNDTAFFKITTRVDQSIDMGGQLMDMGNETVHTAEIKVVDVDDKGVLTVEFKVHTVRGSMTLPMMGDLEFDSTAKEEAAAGDGGQGDMMPTGGLKQAMTSLAGKTVKARIAPHGEAVELMGVKELIADAQKKAGGMGRQMLAGTINEGAFKRLIQGCFGSLPKEPTTVGGTWRRQNSQAANRGAQVLSDLSLKLDRADAALAVVAITGTLATPPRKEKAEAKGDGKGDGKNKGEEEDPMAAQQRAMMEQLKVENGKVKGLEEVSRKDGMVLKSTGEMSMDLTVPSPMGAGEMKIQQKTTTTVERTTAEAVAPAPKK